jgi:hypothetical protein
VVVLHQEYTLINAGVSENLDTCISYTHVELVQNMASSGISGRFGVINGKLIPSNHLHMKK